jgi:hypothetical protein
MMHFREKIPLKTIASVANMNPSASVAISRCEQNARSRNS